MPKLFHLVIADDAPITVPDVSPGGAARTYSSPSPVSLVERLAAECDTTELTHLLMVSLPAIRREVGQAERAAELEAVRGLPLAAVLPAAGKAVRA